MNFLRFYFSRQGYWSGSPFPSPRDLPKPGIEPASPALAGRFFPTESAGKPVVLSTLDILLHLMLWQLLWGKFCYYTHFTNEETKSASERWGSCLRSHSKWVVMSGVPELVKVKDLNSRSWSWSSVQLLSHVWLFVTSRISFPVHHQLPELAQTHVHWVSDAIQPFHPLSFPSPPAFSLSQHQGLSQWISSAHQVAEILEFQLQHQSFQWIFRTNFL